MNGGLDGGRTKPRRANTRQGDAPAETRLNREAATTGKRLFLGEREESINDGYFGVDMAGYAERSQMVMGDSPASYHIKAAGAGPP